MNRWKEIVYTIAAIQIGVGIAVMGVVTFIPLFIFDLGIEDPGQAAFWAGLISGITPFMIALTNPWWTVQCEKHGHKRILMSILLCMTVLMLSTAFVQTPQELFFLRMLQGASGGFIAIGLSLIAYVTPAEKLPWAMGLFQAAMVMGIMVGPVTGGLVADTLGYRVPFLLFGGLAFFCFLLTYFLIHVKKPEKTEKSRVSMLENFRYFLSNPLIRLMILMQFLVNFGLTGIGPILPLYIKQMSGNSPMVATLAGVILFAAGLTSALSSMSVGKLSSRISYAKLLLGSTIVTGVLFIIQYWAPNVFLLGVFRAMTGLSIGLIMPIANTILTTSVPAEKRSIVIGVTSSASMMGNVAGPICSGAIAMQYGYGAVFWSTALFFMAAAWMLWSRKGQFSQ